MSERSEEIQLLFSSSYPEHLKLDFLLCVCLLPELSPFTETLRSFSNIYIHYYSTGIKQDFHYL